MSSCNATVSRVKAILIMKKGMASKACINNIKTGNTKKLSKQIDKGTVKIMKYES